ncbi:glycosyltransferase family 2 protein [Synechococcus sp. AH-224-G16]|nr:glycosyltransferase family 2 protein [Synechococcus sp. AH-224-G16]
MRYSTQAQSEVYLSIIVPVYCAEKSIAKLTDGLAATFQHINYEIILVNDCSRDNSWEILRQLSYKDSRIKSVNLAKNSGQHAATLCGISIAKGNWIGTIDDDLEQSPSSLHDILNRIEISSCDVIYGIYEESTHAFWRTLSSKLVRLVLRQSVGGFVENFTSLRVIRGSVARKILTFNSSFPFIDGYLSWVTNSFLFHNVNHFARYSGQSGYKLYSLLSLITNILVGFSDLPLKFVVFLGLFMSTIGFLWLTGILFLKLIGVIQLAGYTSLMAALLTLLGIQLLILGILGIYLTRLVFNASNKPNFIVRETINLNS